MLDILLGISLFVAFVATFIAIFVWNENRELRKDFTMIYLQWQREQKDNESTIREIVKYLNCDLWYVQGHYEVRKKKLTGVDRGKGSMYSG